VARLRPFVVAGSQTGAPRAGRFAGWDDLQMERSRLIGGARPNPQNRKRWAPHHSPRFYAAEEADEVASAHAFVSYRDLFETKISKERRDGVGMMPPKNIPVV
jgi:hypothetical protein